MYSYALIFMSLVSFFQLFSMNDNNKQKSTCCNSFEWVWCCETNKSSERLPITSHKNIQIPPSSPKAKNKKQGTSDEKDKNFIPFVKDRS